jgi:hypothetical protein
LKIHTRLLQIYTLSMLKFLLQYGRHVGRDRFEDYLVFDAMRIAFGNVTHSRGDECLKRPLENAKQTPRLQVACRIFVDQLAILVNMGRHRFGL